jgi:glycosyltransferase involved in cell wall biosynthesis
MPELVRYEQNPNIFRATHNPLQWLGFAVQMMQSIHSLRVFLRERNVQVLHTNSWRAHAYGVFACLASDTALVWHIRDRTNKRWLKVLLNVLGRRADAIIAISRTVASALPAERRVSVIYDPMRIKRTACSAEESASARETHVVGTFGQVVPWKGQDRLIAACSLLIDDVPDLELVVVGSSLVNDSDYSTRLKAMVSRGDLCGKVRFLGFQEDVLSIMRRCGVVVSASEVEPLGRTVVEAMSVGAIVVAGCAGGPAEIVEDGISGFLCDTRDPRNLATVLRRALTLNRDDREAVAAAASRRVVDMFGPEAYARGCTAVQETYARAIAARSRK